MMLYIACSTEQVECHSQKFPMISDIIALPYYDRIFILQNTIYFIGLNQVSVRAFYKLFNGILEPSHNLRLFYAGFMSSFSLPMIGVFDNGSVLKNYHNLFAF